jgi:hypothetical protein
MKYLPQLIILLSCISISFADDTLIFNDFTFSSVLKVCNNNSCSSIGNGNSSNYSDNSTVFEVNGIQDISTSGFFYNNFAVLSVAILLLLVFGFALWKKKK